MDYKEFQDLIIDYISENLSESKKQSVEAFLKENPKYNSEIEEMKLFWNAEDEDIPEPTAAMDINFYTMLNSEKNKENRTSITYKIVQFFKVRMVKQFVYTLAILTIGFFFGKNLNQNNTENIKNIQMAEKETQSVRSQLVLTLLEQPSVNKRLQAVSEVNKMNSVTETIIKALFTTLNNDDNVNVRLSSVEALSNYTNIPLVREGLIASISKQTSPLVQIALADLMEMLQEKKAVAPFKELIEEESTNESVKKKVKESIENII